MRNVLVALVTVLAVVAVRAVLKLALLPVRTILGLVRRRAAA